jgi:hypothetical protein
MHFLFCADVFLEKNASIDLLELPSFALLASLKIIQESGSQNIPAFFKYMKSVDLSLTSFRSDNLQIPTIIT